MKAWIMAVLIAGAASGVHAQTPRSAAGPTQEDSRRLVALQAMLDLDPGRAWRVDSWREQSELVLRVVPADAEAELRPVKTPTPSVVEARAAYDESHALTRVTITHVARGGMRVPRQATDAERTAAVSAARFAPEARGLVLAAVRGRSWAALGDETGIAGQPVFGWRRTTGDGERAVWDVRITAKQRGRAAVYVATLDAADGSLLELVRQEAR